MLTLHMCEITPQQYWLTAIALRGGNQCRLGVLDCGSVQELSANQESNQGNRRRCGKDIESAHAISTRNGQGDNAL